MRSRAFRFIVCEDNRKTFIVPLWRYLACDSLSGGAKELKRDAESRGLIVVDFEVEKNFDLRYGSYLTMSYKGIKKRHSRFVPHIRSMYKSLHKRGPRLDLPNP